MSVLFVTDPLDSLLADIDATAAYAQGRRAAQWLRTRPMRSALVVGADGVVTTVLPSWTTADCVRSIR